VRLLVEHKAEVNAADKVSLSLSLTISHYLSHLYIPDPLSLPSFQFKKYLLPFSSFLIASVAAVA
jgi:hypothetical protein